ncbi:MAG: hypothetical protein ACI35W_01590 [Anaeroplasmataceae bacterium]
MISKLYDSTVYFLQAIILALRWSAYGILFVFDSIFTFILNIFRVISDLFKSFMDILLPEKFSWIKLLLYLFWAIVAVLYYIMYAFVLLYNVLHDPYTKLMGICRP